MKTTNDRPQVLLEHYLKTLKLSVFLEEYPKIAAQCAAEKGDYAQFLLRLSEAELIERERRGTERRIKAARFPVVKSIDDFDFLSAPSVNKKLIIELAGCEWIDRRENLILLGNPGLGKSHLAIALGLASCQRGYNVRFFTGAGLVNALAEARDDRALINFQAKLNKASLLIIDELGYIPFSKTGAELIFDIISQRYERGSMIITSNLPFEEWTSVFGEERLTGALLDRLTHRVHIMALEGGSYRLSQSKARSKKQTEKEE